jgi:hypothetical protein
MNLDLAQAAAILIGFATVAGAIYGVRVKLPADQIRALQDTLKTLTTENERLNKRLGELEAQHEALRKRTRERETDLLHQVEQAQAELRKVYEKIGRAVVWSGQLLPEGSD